MIDVKIIAQLVQNDPELGEAAHQYILDMSKVKNEDDVLRCGQEFLDRIQFLGVKNRQIIYKDMSAIEQDNNWEEHG